MSSLTHAVGSLVNSVESLLSGIAEAVLSVFRHAFDLVFGILKGALNLSEEVIQDAWRLIEAIVRAFFSKWFLLILTVLGVITFLNVAAAGRNSAPNSAAVKGKKKRV